MHSFHTERISSRISIPVQFKVHRLGITCFRHNAHCRRRRDGIARRSMSESSTMEERKKPENLLLYHGGKKKLMKALKISKLKLPEEKNILTLMYLSCAGFVTLSLDLVIFHILQHADGSVHAHVLATTTSEWRHTIASSLLSNGPIVAGLVSWFISVSYTAYICSHDENRHQRRMRDFVAGVVACCSIMYCLGGGSVVSGDALFVSSLKHFFHRDRPSLGHSTFAFPSGHSTAAFFVSGVFLYVLLPMAIYVGQLRQDGKYSRSNDNCASVVQAIESLVENKDDAIGFEKSSVSSEELEYNSIQHHDAENGGNIAVDKGWEYRVLEGHSSLEKILVWFLWGGITASGRVLADVHWLTDVMAGCCVGVFLTGMTELICLNVPKGFRHYNKY